MNKCLLAHIIILLLSVLLGGGCAPSITDCKGHLEVICLDENDQASNNEQRYFVITFWDYPSVNSSNGKIKIDRIHQIDGSRSEIDFSAKAYWVVWTPALGTQHIAPEPGVVVFHEDYLPSFNVGGTGDNRRFCCQAPNSSHEFSVVLDKSEEIFLENEAMRYHYERFLDAHLSSPEKLQRKLANHKSLSEAAKKMIVDKLGRVEELLED